MKYNKKKPIKMIKKLPIEMLNKHENLEDENRKHEYFLKMLQFEECDYANVN